MMIVAGIGMVLCFVFNLLQCLRRQKIMNAGRDVRCSRIARGIDEQIFGIYPPSNNKRAVSD